jgi:hypothetical protein
MSLSSRMVVRTNSYYFPVQNLSCLIVLSLFIARYELHTLIQFVIIFVFKVLVDIK